ncbi:hypothetical protein DFH09DRAFT_1068726 [Mycena vulgaris]|nr:hypothetical protein DFH09DRAFT_1068726 [Mycena vulgaris]
MSRMPCLPGAALHLQVSLAFENETDTLNVDIPPITSTITNLEIRIIYLFHLPHSNQILSSIFTALTPPSLEHLELESKEYPSLPLPWPHTPFLDFCVRSSFDSHLRSLEIYDVNISQAELVKCLSKLPDLENLEISDHQLVPGGGAAPPTPLAQLIISHASPSLVPGLESISSELPVTSPVRQRGLPGIHLVSSGHQSSEAFRGPPMLAARSSSGTCP